MKEFTLAEVINKLSSWVGVINKLSSCNLTDLINHLKELDSLTNNPTVKNSIATQIVYLLNTETPLLNTILYSSDDTHIRIAQKLADILHAIGYLPTSQMITISRHDLVHELIGHTREKTTNLLNANSGKLIFINEAQSLYVNYRDTFGLEAIEALYVWMLEHPHERIIMAGNERLLHDLLSQIPNFERQFSWVIDCQ